MKTCRNHLDLSLAKVGVLSQSSRFIASKSRGFVAIISIYRQQKSQKCLAFCEIRAKNLIFRFRAKILIFSSRANLNIRFIASKSRGFVAIISIYRQQKSRFSRNHLDLSLAKIAKMSCVLRNPCKKFNFTFSCKNLKFSFSSKFLHDLIISILLIIIQVWF